MYGPALELVLGGWRLPNAQVRVANLRSEAVWNLGRNPEGGECGPQEPEIATPFRGGFAYISDLRHVRHAELFPVDHAEPPPQSRGKRTLVDGGRCNHSYLETERHSAKERLVICAAGFGGICRAVAVELHNGAAARYGRTKLEAHHGERAAAVL